jgi:hypothetical protein
MARAMLDGGTVIGTCDGGPGCTTDHSGGQRSSPEVPKLRDGGPVTRTLFNGATKPLWEVASRTVPEVMLPTVTAATLGDGLVESG